MTAKSRGPGSCRGGRLEDSLRARLFHKADREATPRGDPACNTRRLEANAAHRRRWPPPARPAGMMRDAHSGERLTQTDHQQRKIR